MTKHRFQFTVEVDSDALMEFVSETGGNEYPCSIYVPEWRPIDLFHALLRGLADEPDEFDEEPSPA